MPNNGNKHAHPLVDTDGMTTDAGGSATPAPPEKAAVERKASFPELGRYKFKEFDRDALKLFVSATAPSGAAQESDVACRHPSRVLVDAPRPRRRRDAATDLSAPPQARGLHRRRPLREARPNDAGLSQHLNCYYRDPHARAAPRDLFHAVR